MPPRVSLNTSPRASRKAISKANQTDGAAPAVNTFTSALDIPPRRPTVLRRRGSDGDSPRYRDSSSHHHHHKYPSMDSPVEPHPLRRANSTTARTTRNDTGNNTRPRLSRVLSPSTPVLAKSPPAPAAADFPASPDQAESHRAVLAHEVPSDATLTLLTRILWGLTHTAYLPFSRSRRMIHSQASP